MKGAKRKWEGVEITAVVGVEVVMYFAFAGLCPFWALAGLVPCPFDSCGTCEDPP